MIELRRTFLDDFVGLSFGEFYGGGEKHNYYAVLNHLQTALQAVLDIAQYIAAKKLLGTYRENKEVFDLLKRAKIIDPKLAESLKAAIGARNVMVHQYDEVDPKKIYRIVQNNLPDLDQFVVVIGEYLEKEKD